MIMRLGPHSREVGTTCQSVNLTVTAPPRRRDGLYRCASTKDNAFEAHLADVREYGGTVGLDVLVEAQARRSSGENGGERGLAHLDRSADGLLDAVQRQRPGERSLALGRIGVHDRRDSRDRWRLDELECEPS